MVTWAQLMIPTPGPSSSQKPDTAQLVETKASLVKAVVSNSIMALTDSFVQLESAIKNV